MTDINKRDWRAQPLALFKRGSSAMSGLFRHGLPVHCTKHGASTGKRVRSHARAFRGLHPIRGTSHGDSWTKDGIRAKGRNGTLKFPRMREWEWVMACRGMVLVASVQTVACSPSLPFGYRSSLVHSVFGQLPTAISPRIFENELLRGGCCLVRCHSSAQTVSRTAISSMCL